MNIVSNELKGLRKWELKLKNEVIFRGFDLDIFYGVYLDKVFVFYYWEIVIFLML